MKPAICLSHFSKSKSAFMFTVLLNQLLTKNKNVMKLFKTKTMLVNGLLLAGLLSACQNENEHALLPLQSATVSDQNAKTSQLVGQLIKDGDVSLTYDGQNPGNLGKETYSNGTYHVFEYAPQSIIGKRYVNGFNNATMVFSYKLDTYGRCVQTVTDKTYLYEYDSNGQLTKLYNQFDPAERTEFTYQPDENGAANSLSRVTMYNAAGQKTRELLFNYTITAPIPDKSPLNLDVFPKGVSKYLLIFGKFSTNLVQCSSDKTFLPNGQYLSSATYYYSYELDYAGKVKNVKVKKYDGTLVSSTDRKYTTPSYNR